MNGHIIETQFAWYTDRWGGVLGGNSTQGGRLTSQNFHGAYWSQSERCVATAHVLDFRAGSIAPSAVSSKLFGYTLRCVR